MKGEEFDDFVSEIKQLCASLGKAYTDPLAKAYWRALRDIPLDELQANVERILLNAKADTKFPKPAALRSSPPPTQQVINDPEFRAMEERSIRNLEDLRMKHPEEWLKRMGGNNAARLHKQFKGNIWYDLAERCWRRA